MIHTSLDRERWLEETGGRADLDFSEWLIPIENTDPGTATQLFAARLLGFHNSQYYVGHDTESNGSCIHRGGLPHGEADKIGLWCTIHVKTIEAIEKDISRWEIRLLFRMADVDADPNLINRRSRYRLSLLRAALGTLEMRTSDQLELASVRRLHDKICELAQRVHDGYNLLATAATSRLAEVQYAEARSAERLGKTVTLLTAFLLAPALIAQFAQALTPVDLSGAIVLLLAALASVLFTWSILPGFPTPWLGERVLRNLLIGALALVVTASVLLGVYPSAISLGVLVLTVSATVLLASLGRRSTRNPSVVDKPPVMWREQYERWRNDRTKRIATRDDESS